MEFETVIGLEVHAQLATLTKAFATSPTKYGAEPNSQIDPVTLGLPGALPVLNKQVVNFAIMLGLGTNCEIRKISRFARKHYFYPDLPKGYQISQFDEPICERGSIEIAEPEFRRTIGIKRIHIEEDAGKSIHDSRTASSLVDFNRAGVPLLEIVSEPDLRSPAEAAAYMRTIRQIVRFLGVCDGNMEEGSLRCDANVSLRPVGQLKYGTRVEIKNINSFKFVEQALEYEVARQLSILKSGGTITQETRLFDNAAGTTRAMRSKEESADYRYMPDPDLPPLEVSESWINEIKSSMPKLPSECRRELTEGCGLSEYDAAVLTTERSYYDFFMKVVELCSQPKLAANWVTSELFGFLNKHNLTIEQSPVSAENLGGLLKLLHESVISGKIAKQVFEEMFATGATAEEIVRKNNLKQITDPVAVLRFVEDVFSKNPKQLEEYIAGADKLHGFFVGQVLKISGGKANPDLVNAIIKDELNKRKLS